MQFLLPDGSGLSPDVELGWLIDGDNRCVYFYRGAAGPRLVVNEESLAGEGPVEGFVLPLGDLWAGL